MDDTRLLAEVKVTKLKECPTLTAGRYTPLVYQSWSNACHRYMKFGEKKPDEIVSYVADAMLEPRLMAWYQGDQARIDRLTLDAYLDELASLTLAKNWAHLVREEILTAQQGDRRFIDWKIEMENLNAVLTTSAKTFALTPAALKTQLEANLNRALKRNLLVEPVLSNDLAAWANEVKERDERVREQQDIVQEQILANNAARALRRNERKDLAS
jgi:hypothetical protein